MPTPPAPPQPPLPTPAPALPVADLPVLLHTARTGSLTAAAAVLGVTPAATSAMLKRLEAAVGARLFERSTRALRLTPQGQVLLDYATRAFDLLAEGAAQATADRAGLVGELRITAPSDLARTVLLPWLGDFLALHPGVQLSLSVGDRPLDVVRDEVDVAIRYGDLADSRLVARPLLRQRLVLSAAPAYLQRHGTPRTPQDLQQHNCLPYDTAGRVQRQWRFAAPDTGQWHTVRVRGDRRVDDASLAREWAIAGAGILLKTSIEQQPDMDAGRLVRLLPEWGTPVYPLQALLPSGRFVPQRVRAVVEFLAGRFGAVEGLGGAPESVARK